MSEECCAVPVSEGARCCPVSGTIGQPVKWTTVAAIVAGVVPPRQELSLCRDADCEVVYFSDQGLELRVDEVRVVPGFKTGSEGLVCYCFLHAREAVAKEVRSLGESPTFDSVRTKVKEKGCACEVRNPAGKCCLKDVQQIIDETRRQISTEGATE